MTKKARPRYRVVDEHGEVHEECPGCQELEDTMVQMERQIRTVNARMTRMQRDEEAKAREHKRWEEAEAVHTWWRLATGHFGCKFGAEEFRQVEPRLKEVGPIGVLQAVAGAAFDPGTKRQKNGHIKRFDDWELVTRTGPKLQDFQARAPGWPVKKQQWKHWLLERIEENLRDKEEK